MATATAALAPGTTLLKTSLLQSKPPALAVVQQPTTVQQSKVINRNTNPSQLLNSQQKFINCDKSGQIIASLGMETKQTSSNHNNNNSIISTSLITQTVQKLPQVSLLQNSKNKPTTNIIVSGGHNTTIDSVANVFGKNNTEKINENIMIQNNSNEIRMGNLSAEVSLIKKPTLNTENISTNSNAKRETSSLLKPDIDFNRKIEKSPENGQSEIANNITHKEIAQNEKQQESLLKIKNNNSEYTPPPSTQVISPRNQRSKSYNSALKCTQKQTSPGNANGERRHSEPAKLGKVIEINFSAEHKPSKIFKSNLIDDTQSENVVSLQEDFEEEEYLESSGEKSKETMSEMIIHSQESVNENIDEKETETCKNIEAIESDELKGTIKDPSEKCNKNPEEQCMKQETDSDDDVTILPMDDSLIEPIEIDDDDDVDNGHSGSSEQIVTNTASPSSKDKLNESLLCDEQILVSSSSSISNQSLEQITSSTSSSTLKKSHKIDSISIAKSTAPILKKSLTERKHQSLIKDELPSNGYSAVLDMLSNFNMLNWRERLGTGRGTNIKFQLNEFNLVQLYEKIPARTKPHTSFEKPVYERDDLQIRSENGEPLIYYMCRRCKVRAPALDFLAPGKLYCRILHSFSAFTLTICTLLFLCLEFCSMYCLKRDCRKRQREDNASVSRKKQRYVVNNNNPPPLAYITQPKFRWSNYLKANYTSMAAPISLFLNPFPTGPNNFKIGMKLEAIDPENCALFCVCTVVDINGYRLKLSFDGYDSSYDFWLNADSMDIFPPGWCAKTNRILQPPRGVSANKFNWGAYLNKEKSVPAPRHLFTHLNSSSLIPRNPFQVIMKLSKLF